MQDTVHLHSIPQRTFNDKVRKKSTCCLLPVLKSLGKCVYPLGVCMLNSRNRTRGIISLLAQPTMEIRRSESTAVFTVLQFYSFTVLQFYSFTVLQFSLGATDLSPSTSRVLTHIYPSPHFFIRAQSLVFYTPEDVEFRAWHVIPQNTTYI